MNFSRFHTKKYITVDEDNGKKCVHSIEQTFAEKSSMLFQSSMEFKLNVAAN